mmetsp:Transcript_24448/g.83588  ORF Transcript_24448/g.83588 Transcript_24448/m.83588 type:complete len:359 (-) Transcript_24448:1929-3005(-)
MPMNSWSASHASPSGMPFALVSSSLVPVLKKSSTWRLRGSGRPWRSRESSTGTAATCMLTPLRTQLASSCAEPKSSPRPLRAAKGEHAVYLLAHAESAPSTPPSAGAEGNAAPDSGSSHSPGTPASLAYCSTCVTTRRSISSLCSSRGLPYISGRGSRMTADGECSSLASSATQRRMGSRPKRWASTSKTSAESCSQPRHSSLMSFSPSAVLEGSVSVCSRPRSSMAARARLAGSDQNTWVTSSARPLGQAPPVSRCDFCSCSRLWRKKCCSCSCRPSRSVARCERCSMHSRASLAPGTCSARCRDRRTSVVESGKRPRSSGTGDTSSLAILCPGTAKKTTCPRSSKPRRPALPAIWR